MSVDGWPPIFHLALAADWAAAQDSGQYDASTRGVGVAETGFVHAAYAEQVPAAAEAHFRDGDDVVLLAVDPARTGAEVRVEGGFPHVYGPLPLGAVVATRPYARAATGRFPAVTVGRSQRIAAYALMLDDGRVLLSRLSARTGRPGAWTLPGGGLDHGEDPAAAARRETYEETGLEVDVVDLLGVHSRHWIGWLDTHLENHHGLRLVYRAVARDPRREGLRVLDVGGSTDAAGWVRLTDLAAVDALDLVTAALAMDAAAGQRPAGRT